MHDLSINASGKAELVLADEGAWHRFGTVFDGPVSIENALAIAFPWVAEKEQLIRASTGQASNAYGIYRSDTGAEIGTCSSSYEMVQVSEMFTFTEGLSVLGYESAGALKGGSVLFVSARVGEVNVLGSGDITRTYVAFLNSFDGSIAAQAFLTGTRIVCQNTLQASLRDQQGRVLKFRHTKNVHNRLEQAKAIMESQHSAQEALQVAYDTLAQRKVTRKTYEAFLDDLFPGDSTKTKNTKAEVTALFADNDNHYIPEFAGTAYAALNAVSNYVDHHAHVRLTKNGHNTDVQSQRFESAILGTGAELKTRALERILVLSDGSETCESAPIYSMPSRNVTSQYLPPMDTPEEIEVVAQSVWQASVPKAIPDDSNRFNYHLNSEGVYTNDQDDTPDIQPMYAWRDSLPMPEGYGNSEVSNISEPLSVVYTTADKALDMPGVALDDIIETISDTVAVRRVLVPMPILDAQKATYANAGCLAASHEEWTALKR